MGHRGYYLGDIKQRFTADMFYFRNCLTVYFASFEKLFRPYSRGEKNILLGLEKFLDDWRKKSIVLTLAQFNLFCGQEQTQQ